MTLTLVNIVRDWLKTNRPFMFIDHDSISARGNGCRYIYADIENDYIEVLNQRFETVRIDAADPEFFEKLAKHLPPKL